MRTTLKKFLENADIPVNASVYGSETDSVMDFPIADGRFLEIIPGKCGDGIFNVLEMKENYIKKKLDSTEYQNLCQKLRNLEIVNKDGLPKEALKDLRLEKKVIKTQMEELKQEYENDANRHFFGRFPAEICGSMIQYKNCVTGTSMGELSQQVPQFKKVQGHLLWDMPIFTDNILGLSQALEEKRPLAVLGGPCLFGSWELGISFMDSKGNIQWFDFSSGKNYLRSGDTVFDYSLDIQDYLNKNNNKITEIHFKNYKKDITSQEYDALDYVFAFAKQFGASAFIPIPDRSYQKYLHSLFSVLEDRSMVENAEREFASTTDEITLIFLKRISEISSRYPSVPVTVMHSNNPGIWKKFEIERVGYLEKKQGLLRQLTRRVDWKESIIDYITMPALPLYLEGIKDVIEVDCIDEMESYRKCQKIHGKALNIYPFFYADRLSSDGKNAIFYAKPAFKEYLNREEPSH